MEIIERFLFHCNDYGPIELNEVIAAEHKASLKSLFCIIAINLPPRNKKLDQILEKENKTPSHNQGIIIGWST